MSLPEIQVGLFETRWPEYIILVDNKSEDEDVGATDDKTMQTVERSLQLPAFKEKYDQGELVWLTVGQGGEYQTVTLKSNALGVYRKDEAETEGSREVFYSPAKSWYNYTVKQEVLSVMKLLGEHGASKVKLTSVEVKRKSGFNEEVLPEAHKAVKQYRTAYRTVESRLTANVFDKPSAEKYEGYYYAKTSASMLAAFKEVWENEDRKKRTHDVEYEVKYRKVNEAISLHGMWEALRKKNNKKKKKTNVNAALATTEFVRVKLRVEFEATLQGPWPKYNDYPRDNYRNLHALLSTILGMKARDEAAFGAVRLVLYGTQNAGKSCTIYSWLRSVFGKHGYMYMQNRCAPPQMNVRGGNANVQDLESTTFMDAAEETHMNFYRLFQNTGFGEGNRYNGSLILCDTQGFDLNLVEDLGKGTEGTGAEEHLKMHAKKTLKKNTTKWGQANHVKEDRDGKLREWGLSSRLVYNYLCGPILPDMQVFVISAEDFITDSDVFEGSCQALREFRTIATREGGIVDDFVVLLTKYDKFVEACRGNEARKKAEMVERVQEYLPKRRPGGAFEDLLAPEEYIFTITNHTVPTMDNIKTSIGSNAGQEEIKWTQKNDEAFAVMTRILEQVRVKRTALGGRNYHWMKSRMFQMWREKNENDVHDIFLSYNQGDARDAFWGRKCAVDIMKNGFVHRGLTVHCDVDQRDRSVEMIFKNVKAANVCVALLTKSYFNSDFCLAELICAYYNKKEVILVVGLNKEGQREQRHSQDHFEVEKVLKSRLNNTKGLTDLYEKVSEFYDGSDDVENFVLSTLQPLLKDMKNQIALRRPVKADAMVDRVAQDNFLESFATRWQEVTGEKI